MGDSTFVITITGENFEAEVLKSPLPVLLDFWAAWCGPCKMIGPIIEQLGTEYEGRLKVGKVNVDEQGELAGRHAVVSIPTLIVYKDGSPVQRQVGAAHKAQIEALFKGLL
ncbi:MAG: thioredoxin [Treponema sp.]|jgi:thioredoxin 1|nr:thioredoxin [Treponema sp.]